MRILADTNLFVKFYHRQPLPDGVETALNSGSTERFLSSASVIEIYRLSQAGRILINPDTWMNEALETWTILPITAPIARQSVLWDWPHKDPADRILAATAQIEKVELWHTDTILKKFRGFPQRYFTNKP